MREGYFKMAQQEPSRIRIVDASGAVEDTHSKVLGLVLPLLDANINEQGLRETIAR